MNPTTIIVFMAGALLGALPAFESPFAQSMALTCLMYAGLAVSWSMFSGPTRYLSLATSAFFGLGAYCTAWGLGKLPWPAVVMLGGCAAVVFAFLIGLITLRGRPLSLAAQAMVALLRQEVEGDGTSGEWSGTI